MLYAPIFLAQLFLKPRFKIDAVIMIICSIVIIICAADFSLLNLPKGKSLGRSKPATNS